MKQLKIILVLIILFPFQVFSQNQSGTEIDFLSIGAGARPLGMGGTFIGIADDVNATYWNIGGLSEIKRNEITGMHTELFLGTTYDYVGLGIPIKIKNRDFGTIGASWLNLSVPDIPKVVPIIDPKTGKPKIDENGKVQVKYEGTYNAYQNGYIIGYSKKILKINFGGTVKIITYNIGEKKGEGISFDVGTVWTFPKWFRFGLVVKDINFPEIKWRTGEKEKIPANIGMGLSYRILNDKLIIGYDITQQIKTEGPWHKPESHIGAEILLAGLVALRIGIDDIIINGTETTGNVTGGIGFKSEYIKADYAYVSSKELQTTHRLGLSILF